MNKLDKPTFSLLIFSLLIFITITGGMFFLYQKHINQSNNLSYIVLYIKEAQLKYLTLSLPQKPRLSTVSKYVGQFENNTNIIILAITEVKP